MLKKGQVNIDFGAGFFMFILVVTYIAASFINNFPNYYENSVENELRIGVWTLSEFVINKTESNSGILDKSKIDDLNLCDINDVPSEPNSQYNQLRQEFKVGDNEFHINFTEYPIAITDNFEDDMYNGNLLIDGEIVKFEVYPNEDKVDVDGVTKTEEEVVLINGNDYTIENIDDDKLFVILSRQIINCGRKPGISENSYIVNRYLTYDGHLTKIEVEFW